MNVSSYVFVYHFDGGNTTELSLFCCFFVAIGYSIRSDLHMLSKSWPFVSSIVSTPLRVLDLQKMERMVRLYF